MGSRSKAGAIFCLRRRSFKNELRTASCCGFTSSSAKEPFCQTFSRTALAPPEELLIQRSQSRSHFQRSQSPTKQALSPLFEILEMHVLRGISAINSDSSDRRVFNVVKYTPPGTEMEAWKRL